MTNNVVHLADVIHVAYSGTVVKYGKRKSDKVVDTVREVDSVEVQVNPHRKSKRKHASSSHVKREQHVSPSVPSADGTASDLPVPQQSPAEIGVPTRDAYLNVPDFRFNNNVTALSHDTLCNDPYSHGTQGQFCSDFRNLESLYPVFSPSTMPGFADIVIPSRKCSQRSLSAKHHEN